MNKRIERINNFRYPISQPTVFDEEELTVLELASKNASKTNEIIDLLDGKINLTIETIIKNKLRDALIKFAIDEEEESLVLQFDYDETNIGECGCDVSYDGKNTIIFKL